MTEALVDGSMFDSMMFDTREDFEQQFVVLKYPNAFPEANTNPGKVVKAVKEMIAETGGYKESMISLAHTKLGIKESVTSVFDKLVKGNAPEHFEELGSLNGRLGVTREKINKFEVLRKQLLNHPTVGWLFKDDITPWDTVKKIIDSDDKLLQEVHYQVAVHWVVSDLDCKGLLDIMVIDHENKTIKGYDLKTTSSKDHDYEKSAVKYGYDTQAGMYLLALQAYQQQHEELKDYTLIRDFDFVFVEKSGTFAPMIFRIGSADTTRAINGGDRYGKRRKGVYTLLHELNWHLKNDKWEYPQEVYNQGHVTGQIYDNAL